MDYTKLKNHIIDMMKEEQLKLGYRNEAFRLYYPLLSLNRFLSADHTAPQMRSALKPFCAAVRAELGEIEISNQGDRFCFTIPKEGSDYVHAHMGDTAFLSEFIRAIEKHGCTIDDLLAIFHGHSEHVHAEKITDGEFDYLIYFEDGKPDDFRYCLTDEGCHIIYHRFTPDDYKDLIASME